MKFATQMGIGLIPLAISVSVTLAGANVAHAVPINAPALVAAAPTSDVQLAVVVVRHGPALVVGRRYHGGVWYGTGRRFYGGRWWSYGVGTCWRPSPIGYVWVC